MLATLNGTTARMLVGWMDQNEGERLLLGGQTGVVVPPEVQARVAAARCAVAARSTGPDQTDLVQEPPNDLKPYVDVLQQGGTHAAFFAEGWEIAVVDLERVCAMQPAVTDKIDEGVIGVDPENLESVARVTLPTSVNVTVQTSMGPTGTVWMLVSSSFDLRVLGNFAGQVTPNSGTVYGFPVGVTPSALQVLWHGDRYVLRDGYHRALGLLRAGVTRAPAFVWHSGPVEPPLPAGLLPASAYMGERPPTLRDYLDETVSAEGAVPLLRKVITISVSEGFIPG